jgi:hypothetical protein
MKSASALRIAAKYSGGVGELNAAGAAQLNTAPNPQANLTKFVTIDPTSGQPYFDAASWEDTVRTTPGWSETDWSETDWSETDWSETDWSETDWSETDWSETDWSETDWSETDWSETDWSE